MMPNLSDNSLLQTVLETADGIRMFNTKSRQGVARPAPLVLFSEDVHRGRFCRFVAPGSTGSGVDPVGSTSYKMAPSIRHCGWIRHLGMGWDRASRAHSLQLCLLYLHFTSCFFAACGQSLQARQFVMKKEDDVKAIAIAAKRNWEQALQGNCSDLTFANTLKMTCSKGCSTNECEVPETILEELICVSFDNSYNQTGCSRNGARCDNVLADYTRSFISFPESASFSVTLGEMDLTPSEVDFAICIQMSLDDDVFKDLAASDTKSSSSSEDAYVAFNYYYFASVDGSMRTFPGRRRKNCTQDPSVEPYDPRKRPWYKGAISVVHDLVILLDCGSSMHMENVDKLAYSITRIQYSQNFTYEVLQTLSAKSTVSVITFQANQSTVAAGDEFMAVDSGGFQRLQDLVRKPGLCSTDGATSNLTLGLTRALDMFNSSGKADDSNSLKIIMLLTDGNTDISSAAMDAIGNQIKKQNIKLFLYQIGEANQRIVSNALPDFTCGVGGSYDFIVVEGNELYHARNYFSFLAACHAASNESRNGTQLAFWQPVYEDRDVLGFVITVAYPVISDDLDLIGVAAIDIQVGRFPLKESVSTILSTEKNTGPFHYSSGVNDPQVNSSCQAKASPALSCSGSGLGAVCPRHISDDQITSHVCCDKCLDPGPAPEAMISPSNPTQPSQVQDPKKNKKVSNKLEWAMPAGVVFVLVAGVVLYMAWRQLRRPKSVIAPPPRSNRPLAGDDRDRSNTSDDTSRGL